MYLKKPEAVYIENYKTMVKEIREDTNRWRNILCSWIRRIDIVKMSICQQIWKTQQCPWDWKRSVFIRILKKGNAKE